MYQTPTYGGAVGVSSERVPAADAPEQHTLLPGPLLPAAGSRRSKPVAKRLCRPVELQANANGDQHRVLSRNWTHLDKIVYFFQGIKHA